jgi:outer membrane autotransporter protein
VIATGLLTGKITYAAGGTVTAGGGITGDTDFAGNSGTLNLAAGQLITGTVDNTVAAGGTLNLTGATVTGAVGSTNSLNTVTFNAGDSELQSTANAGIFRVADAGANVIASGKITGSVKYDDAGSLLSSGGIDGDVDFAGNNGQLTIQDGTLTGNIKSAGSGVVNMTNGAINGNIGDDTDHKTTSVNFTDNNFVTGDIYTNLITITSGAKATFSGNHARDKVIKPTLVGTTVIPRVIVSFTYTALIDPPIGINNADASSAINTISPVIIDGNITNGQAIFDDNVLMQGSITNANRISFAANKYAILEQNIQGTNITADRATLIIDNPQLTIEGNLTARDLTIDLATNQVHYSGGIANLTGTPHIRTIYDSVNQTIAGKITIGSGAQLDLSNATNLVIDLIFGPGVEQIPVGTQYILVVSDNQKATNLKLDPAKIIINTNGQANRFTKVTADGNSLILIVEDPNNGTPTFNFTGTPEEENLATILAAADPDSDAGQIFQELKALPEDQRSEFLEDLLHQSVDSEMSSLETVSTLDQIYKTIEGRFELISDGHFKTQTINNPIAIAAGDDKQVKYGIWATSLYNKAIQRMRAGFAGYKMKSSGVMFGGDAEVTDRLLLGLAYGRINSSISHHNNREGNKADNKYNIFSAYGLYNLSHYNFIEGTASYTTIKVTNHKKRLKAGSSHHRTCQRASSSYVDKIYNGQLLFGHNFQPSNHLVISPIAGVRYTHINGNMYKEHSADFKNLFIKRDAYNKWEAILGVRTAALINIGQTLLIPETRIYLHHDFKGKAPITDVKLGGYPGSLPSKQYKPFKTLLTIGGGVTIRHNKFEYGINYDASLSQKYIAHQGSLQLGLNF